MFNDTLLLGQKALLTALHMHKCCIQIDQVCLLTVLSRFVWHVR